MLGEPSVIIIVKNHREDKYGRILGTIMIGDKSLADEIIAGGHGVAYEGGKRV